VRLVLLDWDGTIVDSMSALFATYSTICDRLGLPFNEEIWRCHFSPNWQQMYRGLGITDGMRPVALEIWAQMFRDAEKAPFPGVVDALKRLVHSGISLGIVTGADRREVEPQIGRLVLGELLPIRVYGDEVTAQKPAPDPLLRALELAGVVPSDAVYIGDALDDMRMAAAAHTSGVGISSTIATPQELTAAGAAETATSVVDWVNRHLAPTLDNAGIGPSSPPRSPRP
jgi:HAD superfamily hydrolase (TIGR01549 family)